MGKLIGILVYTCITDTNIRSSFEKKKKLIVMMSVINFMSISSDQFASVCLSLFLRIGHEQRGSSWKQLEAVVLSCRVVSSSLDSCIRIAVDLPISGKPSFEKL